MQMNDASSAAPIMMYSNSNSNSNNNYHRDLHLQLQLQHHKEMDRRALYLNNRACVMVLSKGDYSEANALFDSALMIHKEHTEEANNSSPAMQQVNLPQQHQQQIELNNNNNNNECYEGCDSSSHSYDPDFGDLEEYDVDDFGEMDLEGKNDEFVHTSIDSQLQLQQQQQQQQIELEVSTTNSTTKVLREGPPTQSGSKISRMTSFSRLQSLSYSGQQEYHEEKYGRERPQHHQVYSLPIVMEETEWDTAPVQDKSFVLIFNTALCNHLWGMQLMQQYLEATASNNSNNNSNNGVPSAAMAQHCRETLTVAKLLYKLALENSVSFANGVDKMCYVALYNNLSHVCKTLEGYESLEAQWCDDMLLKAIFWWRDSTHAHQNHHHNSNSSSNNNNNNNNQLFASGGRVTNNNNNNSNDMYLDEDIEIVDAFFDNVYYRIGVPKEIAPAAAA